MKNERLMDALGAVSPDYVTEAISEHIPKKKKVLTRARSRVIAVVAALVALMTLAIGVGISAEEEPALEELPVIILKEDFDRMVIEMYKEIEGKDEFMDLTHYALRCVSFYELRSLENCPTERAKLSMLENCPITAVADVYVLDLGSEDSSYPGITDVEKQWLLDQFRSIGFSQLDLIESYENLYRMVEESDVDNKEEIYATLPPIPDPPVSEVGTAGADDARTEQEEISE